MRKAKGAGNPASPDSTAAAAAAANEKRLKLTLLEDKLKKLEEENAQLKSQLRVGKEPVEIDEQARMQQTEALERLVNDANSTDSEIKSALKQYVIKFSDYGPVRSQIVEKHMEQLDRLLAPTQLSKLVMWSMQRDDEQDVAVKHDLWEALCEEISATEEQKVQFQRYRENMVQFTKELRTTNQECQELRTRLQQKNRAFGTEMAELTTILTPRQLAVFILFVSKNHANSAMLSRLWDSELKRVMKARLSNNNV